MTHPTVIIVLLALLAAPRPAPALADGGRIRASRQHADWRITVFTSPNPLRAGPADVSILVQHATTGQVADDAAIAVTLTPLDGAHPPIRAAATRAAATNKLLHAAQIKLPEAGRWLVRAFVTIPDTPPPFDVTFAMDVEPPLPAWLTVWPWFVWPIVAVLFFIVHRALLARTLARGSAGTLAPRRGGRPAAEAGSPLITGRRYNPSTPSAFGQSAP